MPIIKDRQRQLAVMGRIRIGETKISQGGKPYPASRETFRFTSSNEAALKEIHAKYGGTLRKWDKKPGQWELLSNAQTISVIVDTTMSADERYELYDGQTRTRHCDGESCFWLEVKRKGKTVEGVTDHGKVPCLCDPEDEDVEDKERECDVKTTLRVMIPETMDVVRWELQSKGLIFNAEVFGILNTLRDMGMRMAFCHLTITQMESTTGAEKKKWVVPQLTLDPNPPEFAARLLAGSVESQVQRTLAASAQALPPKTNALPAPADKDYILKAFPKKPDLDAFKALCVELSLDWKDVVAAAIARKIPADASQVSEFAKSLVEHEETEGEFRTLDEDTTAKGDAVSNVLAVIELLLERLEISPEDGAVLRGEAQEAKWDFELLLRDVAENSTSKGIEAVRAKIAETTGGLGL
jgi:hypothetical protein